MRVRDLLEALEDVDPDLFVEVSYMDGPFLEHSNAKEIIVKSDNRAYRVVIAT